MQRFIPIENRSTDWAGHIPAAFSTALLLLLGLAFGAVALGLGLVLGLGVAARLWWLRRRWLRRSGHQLIVGEYQVLERHG